MKISDAIARLQQIQADFGDLTILGGTVYEDNRLCEISPVKIEPDDDTYREICSLIGATPSPKKAITAVYLET